MLCESFCFHSNHWSWLLACAATLSTACSGSATTDDPSSKTKWNGAATFEQTQDDEGIDEEAKGCGCAPTEDPEYTGFECSSLERMNVTEPVVVDESGDGIVSPGETATVLLNLNEISGEGFYWYPTVRVTSSDARAEVSASTQFYAILPCTTLQVESGLRFADTIPPGTTVRFTAAVAALSEDCEDAPSLEFKILVGE